MLGGKKDMRQIRHSAPLTEIARYRAFSRAYQETPTLFRMSNVAVNLCACARVLECLHATEGYCQ